MYFLANCSEPQEYREHTGGSREPMLYRFVIYPMTMFLIPRCKYLYS